MTGVAPAPLFSRPVTLFEFVDDGRSICSSPATLVPACDTHQHQSRLAVGPTAREPGQRHRALGAENVVEAIEELEPTIGLEPMTCRLRTEDDIRRSETQPNSGDLIRPHFKC